MYIEAILIYMIEIPQQSWISSSAPLQWSWPAVGWVWGAFASDVGRWMPLAYYKSQCNWELQEGKTHMAIPLQITGSLEINRFT